MEKLIIATKNKGKAIEIKEILKEFPVEVLSMGEAGYDAEIDENGCSFSENALLKAKALFEITGEMVLADDSGLEVDFLNGAPGIFTSRFAGDNTSQEVKNNRIIHLLKGIDVQFRTARFVCSIAFVSGKTSFCVEGTVEGLIAEEPMGNEGFGYDPIFYLPEYKKTFAQLPESIKNKISHRAIALKKFKEKFAEVMKI
ncbi:MAG: XTP/dITP diphosphatase [Clostridiaceae bacterium]|jgi:XTP/dITP diphosphohydrolase|nr:XTP/dITP diphosphatase [Clostridiaceae bacterium]